MFLHLAVKYKWLDDSTARRVMSQLEDLELDGLDSTAEALVEGQDLLSPTRIQVLRQEVRETVREAEGRPAKTASPPRPAPAPPSPRPAAPAAVRGAAGGRAGETAAPAPTGKAPAEPIPGYRVVGKIGVGGMAAVFRAEAVDDGRPLALKILLPHQAKNPISRDRFVREAELLTRFDHPNIVKGHRSGVHNGLYFVVMELIDGLSVQEILDRLQEVPTARQSRTPAAMGEGAAEGPVGMAEDQALEIILQAARALAYMEEQGAVHRDVKPGNLMITRQGGVKLCDLGFAQPIAGGLAAFGEADVTCGTPQYMSPEQASGRRDVDIRSDIYALGATLYHMVLGDVPFKGADSLDVMAKQVLTELYTPGVKQRLSRHMHYFIEKMMAKEKDIRYQSPQEMAEDIGAQITGLRSLQFKHGGRTPSGEERLQALVEPLLPAPPPPPPAAPPKPVRSGLTALFRRAPGKEASTRRFRRLP